MRSFLATCGIVLTLVLGGGAFVPQVSAQGDQTLIDGGGSAQGAQTSVTGATTGTTDPAPAKTPKPGAGGPPTEDLGYGLAWLMTKLMGLFAMMLGIAALTLNYAVYYCVVTMGAVVNQLAAIGVTWRILRDIGNIAILFGFIATGVAVVLGVNFYGDRNKLIPKLLIAAVALNFSLFAAEAVIDVGNLFATQFYIQINGGKAPEPLKGVGDTYSSLMNEGISNKLMAQLGFQNIYGPALNNTSALKVDGMFFISFMSIMLFLFTSLVFFALAFILIQRFVILIALIIVSPIGVAGYAVPQLESTAKKWWSMLFKQTITAPVLLLGLYVALAVITDAQFLVGFLGEGTTADWTGFVEKGSLTGFAGLFLSYLVAMGLLLGVALLSKQLGAFGADRALKWAGAASFGLTAYGMSAGLGGFARRTRRLAQRYRPDSAYTRRYSQLANFAENRTMDLRRVPGVRAGMGLLGAGAAATPVGRSAAGRVDQGREWLRSTRQSSDRLVDQQTRLDNLRITTDAKKLKTLLGNVSDKELESKEMQKILNGNELAVAMLSQAKFDKMMSSDVLSDEQKESLRTKRTNGLTTHYSNATNLQGLSGADVAKLPDSVLAASAVHQHLKPKQVGAIMKGDNISDTTAEAIGNHLRGNTEFNNYLLALIGTNAVHADELMRYFKI